jgi:hypothetical protein
MESGKIRLNAARFVLRKRRKGPRDNARRHSPIGWCWREEAAVAIWSLGSIADRGGG